MPVIVIRMTDEDVLRVSADAARVGLRRAEYIRERLGLEVYRRTGPPVGTRNNPLGRPRKRPAGK